MGTLRVVARINALPDKVDEVRRILLALIEPTRGEADCISYELLQNNATPTDFTFVEEWTSDAALAAHIATPHLQNAVAQVGGLLSEPPDIRRYSLLA